MKKLLLFLMLISTTTYLFAQTNSTDHGDWTTVVQPSYDIGAGSTVNIQHVVTSGSNIRVLFGGTLNIVSDSLIINAELLSFIGGNVFIAEGATLRVNGDLNNTLFGDITIEGSLLVDGDVSNWGSDVSIAPTGSLGISGDFNNSGGSVDNGGSISVGGTVIGNVIDNSSGGTVETNSEDPLPIELGTFFTFRSQGMTVIRWSTLSESQNRFFHIETSKDGMVWEFLATLSGAGTTAFGMQYTYNHYTSQSLYYRLTQEDYDGTTEFVGISYLLVDLGNYSSYKVFDTGGRYLGIYNVDDLQNLTPNVYIIKNKDYTKKIYVE